MRGISKKKLPELLGKIVDQSDNDGNINYLMLRKLLLNECQELQELQEPWMTLDEFLKSGFRGRCWINFRNERVDFCRFLDGTFFNDGTGFSVRRDFIVKVMPIHKPEPPK